MSAPSPSPCPGLEMLPLKCPLSPSALARLAPQSYRSVVPTLHLPYGACLGTPLAPTAPNQHHSPHRLSAGPNCHHCRLQSSSGDGRGVVVRCVPRSSSPQAQPVSAGLTMD